MDNYDEVMMEGDGKVKCVSLRLSVSCMEKMFAVR